MSVTFSPSLLAVADLNLSCLVVFGTGDGTLGLTCATQALYPLGTSSAPLIGIFTGHYRLDVLI
jgi:hypothetical protein